MPQPLARETPKPAASLPPPLHQGPASSPAAPSPARPPALAAAPTALAKGGAAKRLLSEAQAAAAAGSWKEVLRAADDAAGLPRDSDTVELALLAQRASRWSLDSLQAAADAAGLQRYGQAVTTLGVVRREMAGHVQAIDAERGLEAVERLVSLDRGSPREAADLEQARRKAYSEYRGTRWAALFKPTRTTTACAPMIASPK